MPGVGVAFTVVTGVVSAPPPVELPVAEVDPHAVRINKEVAMIASSVILIFNFEKIERI